MPERNIMSKVMKSLLGAKKNDIRLVEDILVIQKGDYRDGIHINNSGQRKLANVMEQIFAR